MHAAQYREQCSAIGVMPVSDISIRLQDDKTRRQLTLLKHATVNCALVSPLLYG